MKLLAGELYTHAQNVAGEIVARLLRPTPMMSSQIQATKAAAGLRSTVRRTRMLCNARRRSEFLRTMGMRHMGMHVHPWMNG